MLFKTTLIIEVPGDDRDDAKRRIATRLGGWKYAIDAMERSTVQPPDITGTADITLPLPGYVNGR